MSLLPPLLSPPPLRLFHTPSPIPIPRAAADGEVEGMPLASFLRSARSFSSEVRRDRHGNGRRTLGRRRSSCRAGGCAAEFVVTMLATFQDQLIFYLTPTNALACYATDRSKSCVHLWGLVLKGSIAHPCVSSSEIEFVITNLIADVLIRYEGTLPDLFHEGHSIIIEGFLKPFTDDLRRDTVGRKVSDKA
uniref:Uncharacterized protein n=1 Tax=Oryza punctata TaxID=4537 RepID=A0A0E0MMU5_ORYPU